jgi:hypothetical protein
MTPPKNPNLNNVNKLVRSLGSLSPQGNLLAGICRSLAEQLDTATGSKTGTQSMAMPNLAKQLQSSITDLLSLHPAEDTFLGYLLSPEPWESEDEYKAAKAAEKAESLVRGAA